MPSGTPETDGEVGFAFSLEGGEEKADEIRHAGEKRVVERVGGDVSGDGGVEPGQVRKPGSQCGLRRKRTSNTMSSPRGSPRL